MSFFGLTRIFSDMASFGRTRLMGVAVKRFLTQVIRHNKEDYNSLDESLMNRTRKLFAVRQAINPKAQNITVKRVKQKL